ncbi:flagellar protein FlaG protein [Syntrophobotulus glycolicus DSM 8271]|uniref:Flagellar protein FlaG protein n=1 Tax=Syntrophobotulus glycolicus (strain DSM 8271 / FlGlyR) TaxID=645991 RepID=F0SZE4_SYNGF|nr:flagellar protein FlaG [Syntrophobotulus glycolicus]ADY54949.1 flagellar protein FlaG protein [Syntrophobotulus glycolicus DSM 8271]
MISQVQPNGQQVPILPVDAYPGQKLEGAREMPRLVVDSKEQASAAKEEIPREEVEKATDKLNRLMGLIEKRLRFSIHEKSQRVMVKVIDQETGDVLQEIPPKRVLDMLSSLADLIGVFIDKKV